MDKLTTAAYHVSARDYGEVLQWLLNDEPDVIHVSGPKTRAHIPREPSEAGTSDGDPSEMPPSPVVTGSRLLPVPPFEQWPFELLEVETSTAKKPDYWEPMSKEMAERITTEAQSGDHSVVICYGKGNKWKYMVDFDRWTQTNMETGTVRKFRFRML
jgi:hypothetical protein